MKLDERSRVGYLIGFDSTKIFRIWDPAGGGTIIRARSVDFDEGTKFSLKDYSSTKPVARLQTLTETIDPTPFDVPIQPEPEADEFDAGLPDPDGWYDTIVINRRSLHTQPGNPAEPQFTRQASSQSSSIPASITTSPPTTPPTRATTVTPGPPASDSSGRVRDDEVPAVRPGNTAPRADQIAGDYNPRFILQEGSKRNKKKRRLAQFAALDRTERSYCSVLCLLCPLARLWKGEQSSTAQGR